MQISNLLLFCLLISSLVCARKKPKTYGDPNSPEKAANSWQLANNSWLAAKNARFAPLNVLLVAPSLINVADIPREIQNALYEAVGMHQAAISVSLDVPPVIQSRDAVKCIEQKSSATATATMVANNGAIVQQHELSLLQPIPLGATTFVLFIDAANDRCDGDSSLMASAKPCYVRGNQRPPAARITVCTSIKRWREYLAGRGAVDLFRHEILHGLGFGTVTAESSAYRKTRAPPTVTGGKWRFCSNQTPTQSTTRRFMDYAYEATEYARQHFGCSALEGIEEDDEQKKHINEYIFGNELMTPVLSSTRNFFSEVSVRILEATYFGASPWYSVNRVVLREEIEGYWYGRGWGCAFARDSCYDFMRERIRLGKSIFPFCSGEEYASAREETTVLVGNEHMSFACNRFNLQADSLADNGVKPVSLMRALPGLGPFYGDQVGSDELYRFCPIVSNIFSLRLPVGAAPSEVRIPPLVLAPPAAPVQFSPHPPPPRPHWVARFPIETPSPAWSAANNYDYNNNNNIKNDVTNNDNTINQDYANIPNGYIALAR